MDELDIEIDEARESVKRKITSIGKKLDRVAGRLLWGLEYDLRVRDVEILTTELDLLRMRLECMVESLEERMLARVDKTSTFRPPAEDVPEESDDDCGHCKECGE